MRLQVLPLAVMPSANFWTVVPLTAMHRMLRACPPGVCSSRQELLSSPSPWDSERMARSRLH
eukprot:484585-Heterocapsa_arctica.AAC.1